MIKVLDLSHYNPVQDWLKVSKEIDCVILKATQGKSYLDPTFYKNRVDARDSDILVGAYHFADGGDVNREVDHFLSKVGEMLEGEFLVLDYEIHLSNPVEWCEDFLNRCEKKTGIRPLLYINTSTFKSFKWGDEKFWLASYGVNDGKYHPIPYPFVLHQYTSRGVCPGINGNVDLSRGVSKNDLTALGKPKIVISTPAPVTPVPEAPVSAQNEPQSFWQKLISLIYNLIK